MAFPSTSLLDNFNRADNASLGGNWTSPIESGDVNPQILSNAWLAGGAFGSSYWSAASFGTNQEVWVVVTTTTTTRLYLCVGGGKWYRLEIDYSFSPHQRQIRYWDGTAYTTVATTTSNITSPEAYGFEKVGTTLTGYVRVGGSWSSIVSGTDSNLSSGNVGIGCYNASLEDFAAGDVVIDEQPFVDRLEVEQLFNNAAELNEYASQLMRSYDGAPVLRNGGATTMSLDGSTSVYEARAYYEALRALAEIDAAQAVQTQTIEDLLDDGGTPDGATAQGAGVYLNGSPATITADTTVNAAAGSVTVNGSSAVVSGGATVNASAGSVYLAGAVAKQDTISVSTAPYGAPFANVTVYAPLLSGQSLQVSAYDAAGTYLKTVNWVAVDVSAGPATFLFSVPAGDWTFVARVWDGAAEVRRVESGSFNFPARLTGLPSASASNVYVIDPVNGNDSNAGTDAAPWKTINPKVTTFAQPGKVVYLRGTGPHTQTGGSHAFAWWNSKGLTPSGSFGQIGAAGTFSQPIVIASYPGETAVMEGAMDDVPFIFDKGTSWVWLSGIVMQNMNTAGGDACVLANGENEGLLVEGCAMSVVGTANTDHGIYFGGHKGYTFGQRNCVIRGNRANDIAGYFLHCYGSSDFSNGTTTPSGQYIVVENNAVRNCTRGILVSREGWRDFLIQSNTLHGIGVTPAQVTTFADTGHGIAVNQFNAGVNLLTPQNINCVGNVVSVKNAQYTVAISISHGAASPVPSGMWFERDNVFWKESGTWSNNPIEWDINLSEYWLTADITVAAYATASGQGTNSTGADPLLDFAGNLTASSPAIDRAQQSTSAYDYTGAARSSGTYRDAGFVEYPRIAIEFVIAAAGSARLNGALGDVSTGGLVVSVNASAGSVRLNGAASAALAFASINASAASVVLNGAAAQVGAAVTVNASAGSVYLNGSAATLTAGAVVNASAGSVRVNGAGAIVAGGITVAASAGGAYLNSAGASVTFGTIVNAAAGSVRANGAASTATAAATVNASAGSVTINGAGATVTGAATVTASAGSARLGLTLAVLQAAATVTAAAGGATLRGAAAIGTGNSNVFAAAGYATLRGSVAVTAIPITTDNIYSRYLEMRPEPVLDMVGPLEGHDFWQRQDVTLYDEDETW